MKTQENVLVDMKNKQQELLKQQENQFNELLKKQISRQSELEDVIRNQQERINSHIQALMTSHAQAPSIDNFLCAVKPAVAAETVEDPNRLLKVELETEVKRLEMEKMRLEDTLSNITDNHEKEVILIEKSYKKRITLMEENFESMEQRYKNEITNIETFFTDKIKSINDERENNLETLKQYYEGMVQNIRQSKFMEFAVKEESSSYADILKRVSCHIETASGDIHSLHEILQDKMIVLERDKEIQLSSREKRLEGNHTEYFLTRYY
jgi:Fas-binding factor 1